MAIKIQRQTYRLGASRAVTLPSAWLDFYGEKADILTIYGSTLLVLAPRGMEEGAEKLINELEFKWRKPWYVTLGCTQHITDSFLAFVRKFLWPDTPPQIPDAVFTAVWTLRHAIEINAGGVNAPIRIAICKDGCNVELIEDEELSEHIMNIDGVVKTLGNHCRSLLGVKGEIPQAPKFQHGLYKEKKL